MQLICQHVTKSFEAHGATVEALADVTFTVQEHEFVCMVGPSGCGKTTLLKIIAGLLPPTSGQIVIGSTPTGSGPRPAMVFQEHGLFPWMTLLDNVAFGLKMQGIDRAQRNDRATTWLERFGLAGFARHYPHELSVGMRQRAGIARAFLIDPKILLMDEPFGALDAQTRLILQDELLKVWLASRKSVVYITHDIEEALRLGDRVLVMTGRPGRIRADFPSPIERSSRSSTALEAKEIDTKWKIWKMLEDEARASLREAI